MRRIVLKTGREFSVLQPFTEDRSALAGPIERATTGAEGGKTDSQGSGGGGSSWGGSWSSGGFGGFGGGGGFSGGGGSGW